MQATACELQEVQLPRASSKLTHLRLVLHSCHQTRSNLFSQVGLASVAALGPPQPTSVVLPMIPSPRKSGTNNSLSPRRRANSAYDAVSSKQIKTLVAKSPRATDIYFKDTHERKTPEQIFAEIQIGKQLAQFVGDDTFVQPWVILEREANRLINLFERAPEPTSLENLQRDADYYTADNLLGSFADLERRRKRQEIKLCQLVSSSPRTNDHELFTEIRQSKDHDVFKRFNASPSQEKEAILSRLANDSIGRTVPLIRQLAITDEETLEILIAALDDSNIEVFVAGCAFLRSLLTTLSYFQDTSASKLDMIEIVDSLVERLDSRDAPIRNAAAFTLLKIAGSMRTRGTFVTHILLRHVESKNFQLSDQQLLALLKLLSALLLSFHCCASFDIAPRRILRFLLLSDADQHESALVREAAKQLVLALCNDVDEEFVRKHYVSKLPPVHQQRYELLHRKNGKSPTPIGEQ
ncbi:hypothetical protein ON010_g7210 [Phytophthora cinnamomi]|nr:hypothetical protein ON010_g7210 [Phytophthora cinnamomi]